MEGCWWGSAGYNAQAKRSVGVELLRVAVEKRAGKGESRWVRRQRALARLHFLCTEPRRSRPSCKIRRKSEMLGMNSLPSTQAYMPGLCQREHVGILLKMAELWARFVCACAPEISSEYVTLPLQSEVLTAFLWFSKAGERFSLEPVAYIIGIPEGHNPESQKSKPCLRADFRCCVRVSVQPFGLWAEEAISPPHAPVARSASDYPATGRGELLIAKPDSQSFVVCFAVDC